MAEHSVIFVIFLIFSGAALLATLALFARQAMIVAYILIGIILGPSGLDLVGDEAWIEDLSNIGIMFLLFLLGLNMHPQKLFRLLGSTTLLTVASSLVFAGIGIAAGFALYSHYRSAELVAPSTS